MKKNKKLKLKIKKVDSSLEKRIITGMIVSKKFLQQIYPFFNSNYFQNSFTQKISLWVIDFYEAFEEVPFNHIQDIFEKEKETLKEEETGIIQKLLKDISERYELEKGINADYLYHQTEQFFRRRELEITANNIQVLLKKNKLDEAENQLIQYNKISKLSGNFVNLFDQKEIEATFAEEDVTFFQFPGALGEFLGDFRRGWLVAMTAPFKRGKTWWLLEVAVIGMLSYLKVVVFSLEMTKTVMNERFYKRFTGTGTKKEGEFLYPCFDCASNQNGTCKKRYRTNNVRLIKHDGKTPDFEDVPGYSPCTYCRNKYPKRYKMVTWYEPLKRPAYSVNLVSDEMEHMKKYYNPYLRLKSYPRFSANIQDIMRDLDILEQTEDFVPDIIIIDYADILKPESSNVKGVEKEDETWMNLARLAGEKCSLVVTVTQGTKESLEAEHLSQKHTSKWIGKLAHVDAMFTANQTPFEKEKGMIRYGCMVHRHKEFLDEKQNVTVLQQLKFGQVNLDSEI